MSELFTESSLQRRLELEVAAFVSLVSLVYLFYILPGEQVNDTAARLVFESA